MSILAEVAEIAAAPRLQFLGLDLPARFADLESECRRLRNGGAMFDGGLRRWLRMRGEDRVDFLQGMVTNDVRALKPGENVYAALLTQQGRVVSDLRVHAAGDHFLLDLPAQAVAAAQAALEKYVVADDVEFEADDAVLIGVEGPQSDAILAAVAAGARTKSLVEATIAGHSVRVAPSTVAGENGVMVGVASSEAAGVWSAIRDAGAEPIGFEALYTLRLEAGIPWVGVDMDEEMLVMEVDLADAISFKKGCYLGQEVVERVAARGHVNRKRVGLEIEGEPVAGRTPLHVDDKEVGWVTSNVHSPLLGRTIGMGYVRREHLAAGTELRTPSGTRVLVAALPFAKG